MAESCLAGEVIEEKVENHIAVAIDEGSEHDKEQDILLEQPDGKHEPELSSALIDTVQKESPKYREVVKSIIRKLDQVQDFTEEVFLNIGNKLPGIDQSLSGVEDEAKNLLEYFGRESSFLSSNKANSESDLDRLNRASMYLIKVAGEQGDAFSKMSEMMKRIDNIKSSIESIREFSAEMEMLSLNAAIVAIKAGDSGRTLNPITVELKKMANSAIALIDDIVKTSDELAEKYNLFQELTEEQVESCRRDAETTGKSLSVRYDTLQHGISGLSEWLNKSITLVSESREPINTIMNTLQVQDILKQCTDHVRLSLNEAGSGIDSSLFGSEEPGYEHVLDTVEFQERVPLLCVQLIDDIDSRLEKSVDTLKSEFEAIGNLVQNITFCARAAETTPGEEDESFLSELEDSFKGIEGVIIDTAGMLQNTANSWEQLWSTAVSLESMLETLEKQFGQLKKMTNFQLINIPIKIEVARSTGLSKDGELSERVEGLAEYISTEMRRAHKDILSDHQFLGQMVESMGKHKRDIETNLEAIAEDIESLLDSFSKAKDQVKKTSAALCGHVSDLTELVQASLHGLNVIQDLIDKNGQLKKDFEELADTVGGLKESVSLVIGQVNWELHDSRLRDIIDRFTVLSHKKIAGGLYDLDVEDGAQEGELILF